MSRVTVELQPCRFILLSSAVIPPHPALDLAARYPPIPPCLLSYEIHTLNTTTNPKSHSFSLFTPVNSSFVSSGLPPFGPSNTSSGCCSYSSRKARARSAF